MKYIATQDLLNQDVLTYQEILNIKKRFGGYSKSSDPTTYENAEFKDEYAITPEHTAKGLEYLFRVAFKPSKLEEAKAFYKEAGEILDNSLRSNCPLGNRELFVLLGFDHFTFTGFYDASNMYQREAGIRALYPLWKTYDKDGDSFEYYLEGGEMNIIG